MFGKKKITTIPELENELKKVYERTEPGVVKEYVGNTNSVESSNRVHTITGCSNCPFVRNTPDKQHCIWDSSQSDIGPFVRADKMVPPLCPLKSATITVNLES